MAHPAALLKAHGLHASKKRGQNFLVNPATARAIAAAAGVGPGDFVLEIGAGLGALTLALAEVARRVVAVEVDRGVFAALQEVVAGAGEAAARVETRLMDALELDWDRLAAEAGEPLLVLGNLPYVITSPLLFALLAHRHQWRAAGLLVQRELADRLLAPPGSQDYGRISVLLQTFLAIRPGLRLSPEQFFPRPQVASRVILLAPLAAPLVPLADPAAEERFRRVVAAAFSQRRKTLLNSLAGGLGIAREESSAALLRAGLDPSRRAETLTPREFGALAAAL